MASKKRRTPAYKKENLHIGWFIPVLFIIGIVPLIVFGRVVELGETEAAAWTGQDTVVDFFSYYKAVYFSVMTYIGFALMLALVWFNRITTRHIKFTVPIGIYVVFVGLSYLVADDTQVATRGFVEMFQGVFVLIAYGLIILTVMNMVRNEKHVKWLLTAFIAMGSVVFLLGVSQFFEFDFFRSEFGKRLILPVDLHHIADDLEFRFGANTIYATMYNTNFVGSFGALMVPLAIALFFYTEKRKHVIWSGVFVAMMVFVAFGSNSRAGLVGLSVGSLIMILFLRGILIKNPKKFATVALLIVSIGLVVDLTGDGTLTNQITRLNPFTEAERISDDPDEDLDDLERELRAVQFEDIKVEGFQVDLKTTRENLRVTFDEGSLAFYDLDDNSITANVEDDDTITFPEDESVDQQFDITLNRDDGTFTVSGEYHRDFDITYTHEDGLRYIRGGRAVEPVTAPAPSIMDGYGQFGSSRGYIWSRSIGMLPDTLALGHGPGMYAIEFPQNDFVGRMNEDVFSGNQIVDKPHNMYLQIGIETGMVSLIALLSVFAMYLFDSLKLFFKREYKTLLDYTGVGTTTAVTAYLGAGIFNDQIISVAPLFYVIVGLGIAINAIIKRQDSIAVKDK